MNKSRQSEANTEISLQTSSSAKAIKAITIAKHTNPAHENNGLLIHTKQ